jgi:16S rRNA (guanine527-N7)-methyltransferase
MGTLEQVQSFARTLQTENVNYGAELSAGQIESLSKYYRLLLKWNPRLHLVGPCSPQEFATRHVLESLLLTAQLPTGAAVADVGSGAGLPIIPCLIVRPDLKATLIEASARKAVFLREALKDVTNSATVTVERFENLPEPAMGFVTCRALERFEEHVPRLAAWAPRAALLLFGGEGLREPLASLRLAWQEIKIPNSTRRFLFVIRRG